MKTAKDPRHIQRIKVMQDLFAWDFDPKQPLQTQLAPQIIKNISKIDKQIKSAAPAWPIEKINKIDLSILRLAVFELTIQPEAPVKVVVDEAVELGKVYGSDSSPAFINGALGKLIADNKLGNFPA